MNETAVSNDLIEAFVASIHAPADARISAADLGIDRQWLERNAAEALDYQMRQSQVTWNEEQKSLFLSAFRGLDSLDQYFEKYFRPTGDFLDCPEVRVAIDYADGSNLVVASHIPIEHMIPWTILSDYDTTRSYSPKISMSLALLLPDGFLNRDRLLGTTLIERLAERTFRQIEQEWGRSE